MTTEQAIELIHLELAQAREKFPTWPCDVVHGAAIVAEESGELVRAALHVTYEPKNNGISWTEMQQEAVQTAVTAIRFLCAMELSGGRASTQSREPFPKRS